MASENLHKDILAYVPAKLIPAVSGILSIWLLTKILKGPGYIDYSFLMALIVIGFQIINGWLNSSVIYLVQKYRGQHYYFFKKSIFTLQSYLLILVSVVVFILAYFGTFNALSALITCMVLGAQMLQGYFFSFFQIERRIKQQTVAASLQSISQIILLAGCYVFYKQNLNTALLSVFIGYMLGNMYSFSKSEGIVSFAGADFIRLNKKKLLVFKQLLSYGIFICLWFFASQFYLIGDRLVLKFQHITENVGGYTAFRDLAIGMSGLLTMPILMASHPEIMRLWHGENDKKAIEKILGFNIRIITVLFAPVLLIVYFSGRWITTTFLGSDFSLDSLSLMLVVLSIYLSAVSMYVHKGFEVKGKTKPMAIYAVLTGIISFGLNILLAPLWGVKACAAIAVFAQVFYIVMCLKDSQNSFSFKPYPAFYLKVLLFCLVSVALILIVTYLFNNLAYFDMIKLLLLCCTGAVYVLKASDTKIFIQKFKKN